MKRILKLRPGLFYLLSLTWGLPLTLCGALAALVMLLTGHRPKRWGPCVYFELGESWGGCEWGLFFLKCRRADLRLGNHELGHGLQNCLLGPLMPFVVSIPSALRYWTRRLRKTPPKTGYDDIWFEGQATRWGTAYMETYYPNKNC